MTREELRSLRVKQIAGWAASGLTQGAYCERESISLKTFSRWRRILREASPTQRRNSGRCDWFRCASPGQGNTLTSRAYRWGDRLRHQDLWKLCLQALGVCALSMDSMTHRLRD